MTGLRKDLIQVIAIVLLFASLFENRGWAQSRSFSDAYRDGFALVLWGDHSSEELDAILERIQKTGASHVTVPYFGCQSSIESSDVGSCEVTLRVQSRKVAERALAKGLSVTFLPIVATPDWKWRGFFDPKDVPAWFRSYGRWIKKVAQEAKELGLKEFIVSSETTLLYRHEAAWKRLLTELRSEFQGPLVVTVNWGDLDHSFWEYADAIGVSSYYPLSQNPGAPPQVELDAAWLARKADFLRYVRKWKRPLHLTEIGYPSVSSAARQPWTPEPDATSDFALQARCFEAFRKAWEGERALVRADVWATSIETSDSPSFPFSFEPLGKPAEQVLKAFFLGRQTL